MAFSNPEIYLRALAEPICRRLEAERTAFDLAVASCIILYHFADVVAHGRGARARGPDVADEIALAIPEFDTVRAIANAAKHVELTRHPKRGLIGLRAEHLTVGGGAAFSDGTFFSDGTTWADQPETIVVQTPDGKRHDVVHVCLAALDALKLHPEFLE